MSKTNKAVRTVSFMIFATLAAKVLGLVRDMFLARYYGTGMEAVAFLAASRIPLLFFDIGLGAAIASTFIPVFNEYLESGDKKKAIHFSNEFVNIVLLITGLLSIIGIVFAKQLANMIAPGFDEQTYLLTVQLIKILFPMIIFTGLAFSLVGILQSFNEFNVPASISLVSNLTIIIYFIFLNQRFGIHGLAVTMVVAWSLQVLVQIPALIKKGYTYKLTISFRSAGIKKVALLALPILVSTWVQPINAMVNIHLASFLSEGSVAALDYANKLYIIIVGVFTYALANFIFPSLSRMSASENKEQFVTLMKTALRTVIYFISPMMIGFILLREPLIKLVYERGAFNVASTQLTSTALLFYSIGMLAFAIQDIMNKGFYALQNASTPMKIAVGGISINILLSFIFVKLVGTGIGGLALAASIAAIIIAISLLISMNKKMEYFIDTKLMVYFIKVIFSTCVMGIIVFVVKGFLPIQLGETLIGKVLNLLIPVGMGVIAYGVITFIMGIQEAKIAFQMIKDKLKRA